MAREGKKQSSNFGYFLTLFLLLLLMAGAVLLLIPSWRELRKRQQEEAEKTELRNSLQSKRNEQMRDINDLRTSKEAPEKVGREKFNLTEKDEHVIKYTVKEQGK